jgi:hypothetical protein
LRCDAPAVLDPGILSIPLGNNTARHQHAKAEFELRRAETALLRLEQSIVSEIRRAARNLAASFEGIEAAERAQVAAAEQLRAERVRLEHGESTPSTLLREQTPCRRVAEDPRPEYLSQLDPDRPRDHPSASNRRRRRRDVVVDRPRSWAGTGPAAES